MTQQDTTAGDGREDEVADVARRAAMAASARQKLMRESGTDLVAGDVDPAMHERLSLALERIEHASRNYTGAMVFRGADAVPILSLLPDFGTEEARRTLTRTATAIRMQFDFLADSSQGAFRNSIISTERGALLCQILGDDMLIISLAGAPPDVAPTWHVLAEERVAMREALQALFSGNA